MSQTKLTQFDLHTQGNLVEHFSIIEDPRRSRVAYDLTEILVIVTCALFAEVESFVDIAD